MAQNRTSLPRNVLVSGGARGIGRAIARYLLEAGHHVYILDIQGDELEYAATQHLKQHYDAGRVQYSVCNLRDVSDIRAQVSRAATSFFPNQRIDVLINNGSIASPYWKDGKTMEDPSTLDEWRAYLETNLTGPFATTQAVIPFMKTEAREGDAGAQKLVGPGPCVVNIGSFRALQSDPNQEGYAASKAGQLGLTHAMAVSLGHLGIRVNLVAPGRIKVAHESREGDEKGGTWEEQVSEKDVSDHPVNRAGRPRDIADACMYLMDAAFVTGQDITVDGGTSRQK